MGCAGYLGERKEYGTKGRRQYGGSNGIHDVGTRYPTAKRAGDVCIFDEYDAYDCRQLGREMEEVDARLQAVSSTLKKKPDGDAVLVRVGVLLFWRALLALPATGGKREEAGLADRRENLRC